MRMRGGIVRGLDGVRRAVVSGQLQALIAITPVKQAYRLQVVP